MRTAEYCNGRGIAHHLVGISSYAKEVEKVMITFGKSGCMVYSLMTSRGNRNCSHHKGRHSVRNSDVSKSDLRGREIKLQMPVANDLRYLWLV